jgi:hypothetical protein
VTGDLPMPPQPRRYRRRLPEVEALLYDGNNPAQVAVWCGGRVDTRDGVTVILVPVGHTTLAARPGDYIVRQPFADGSVYHYPTPAAIFEFCHEPTPPTD